MAQRKPKIEVLTLELQVTEQTAMALAQFVKRVGWQEFRQNAISDEEAYLIGDGVASLQRSLNNAGYAPR